MAAALRAQRAPYSRATALAGLERSLALINPPDPQLLARLSSLLLRPRALQEQLQAYLRPLLRQAIVSGVLEERLLLLEMANRGWIVAHLGGRPLKSTPWPEPIASGVSLADPEDSVSFGEVSPQALFRLTRPRVRLAALCHPETFPLPRFPLCISDLARAIRSRFQGDVRLFDMQLGLEISDLLSEISADQPDIVGISAPFGQHDLLQRLADGLYYDSSWLLDYSPDSGFFVRRGDIAAALSFPLTPAFYTAQLTNGRSARSVVTLYGGGSLGVFVHGNCSLVDMGKACHYCSISPNRSRESEFPTVVSEELLRDALQVALADQACPISQVMINGGNFPDPDRSFLYYTRLCIAARQAIKESGRKVELHLIVYPPADLELLRELIGLDISVAMNLEVFDPILFERFCPGKVVVLGQLHIFAALARAVDCLGAGKVFSILVGGLEDQCSMDTGMKRLAEAGVVPVVNVFHPDPETPLYSRSAPPADRILEMGRSLQSVFSHTTFARPFYLGCGRNSLDTEAYLRLF